MAEPCIPTLVQSSKSSEWFIVTSWHKKDHPKTKYNVTPQIQHIIETSVNNFVQYMREQVAKGELESSTSHNTEGN